MAILISCLKKSSFTSWSLWYSLCTLKFFFFWFEIILNLTEIFQEKYKELLYTFSSDSLAVKNLPYLLYHSFWLFQFSSVTQSCPTLCNPMDCRTPGFLIHHQLPELAQTHVHWVGDAIQPSHPLSSPSPPVPNPSQHQGLFQWVNSSHQVAKVLEFQL